MLDWLPDSIEALNELIKTTKKNMAAYLIVWLTAGTSVIALLLYQDTRRQLHILQIRESMLVTQGSLSVAIANSHLRSQAIWPPEATKSHRTALLYARDVAGQILATIIREQTDAGAPLRTMTWRERPVDHSYRQMLDSLRESNILILTTSQTQPTHGHVTYFVPRNSDLGRLYRNEGIVTAVVVVSSQAVGETIYVSKSFVGELTEDELSLILQITQDTALNIQQFINP